MIPWSRVLVSTEFWSKLNRSSTEMAISNSTIIPKIKPSKPKATSNNSIYLSKGIKDVTG